MRKHLLLTGLIVLIALIQPASAWSQGSIMWRSPAHEVSVADIGVAGGQYYDPQFAPFSPEWLSFEADRDGARTLFIVNLDHNGRFDIVPGKKTETPENALESSTGMLNTFSGQLSWCPARFDGKLWFAFVGSTGTNQDIYVGSTDNLQRFYRITNDPTADDNPVWSPDGKQLAFTSRRSGRTDIYRITNMPELIARMDQMMASNQEPVGEQLESGKWISRLTDDPHEEIFPAWSPDGKSVVYTVLDLGEGDSSGSRLMLRDIASQSPLQLYVERSRILRNPSFSPDGRHIACYSAGSRKDETVDLMVLQAIFSEGRITGAKAKWTKENTRKFEDVKSRVHGGPYWTSDGSLYFLNEKRSQKNSILQIPPEAFNQTARPSPITFLVVSDKPRGAVDFNVRDFDFSRPRDKSEPELVFAAQSGSQFMIYSDRPIVSGPAPTSPLAGPILSISSGLLRYQGDANEATLDPFGEFSLRIPVSDNLSVTTSLGAGSLEGKQTDQNGRTWSFVSSITYLNVMPTYRLGVAGPATFLVQAGAGAAYVERGKFGVNAPDGKTEKVKEIRFLAPLQAGIDLQLFPAVTFMLRGGYTIASGDLDGLPRAVEKSDGYMQFNVGITNLISFGSSGK